MTKHESNIAADERELLRLKPNAAFHTHGTKPWKEECDGARDHERDLGLQPWAHVDLRGPGRSRRRGLLAAFVQDLLRALELVNPD